MPAVHRPGPEIRFRGLFPDWNEARPVRWFFAEQLLEARHRSRFPTGAAGPDEEVNIYLIHLLTSFLDGRIDPRVQPGVWPLLLPPDKGLARRARAEHYRANGDHRLVMLGLMDRGDALRRRRVPWGLPPDEVRRRDLATGAACYRLAADLAGACRAAPPALVRVLERLSTDFEDYVHVLAVLATRRLGLGARLGSGELALLLADDRPREPGVSRSAAPAADLDGLLDALSAYRRRPTPADAAALRARAAATGVDPARLGLGDDDGASGRRRTR